jgi:hypothetical protein
MPHHVSVIATFVFVVIFRACAPGIILLGIVLAESILAIRTWAVCHCDIRVGLLLGALQICNLVISCIYAERHKDVVCELSSSAAVID